MSRFFMVHCVQYYHITLWFLLSVNILILYCY